MRCRWRPPLRCCPSSASCSPKTRTLPVAGITGRACLFRYPGARLFYDPRNPPLVLAQGPATGRGNIVNQVIRRAGNRVPLLTVATLGGVSQTGREQLPPYSALFSRGQLRWTTLGILCGVCAATAAFLIHALLPKALVDQGAAVTFGIGLSSLVYFASIPGKGFTGFLMEIIGRRWTITYALAGSLPGLFLMLMAHRAGQYAAVVMVAGGLITVRSAFTATRVYLSEQFPTALCGRGHIFGESFARLDEVLNLLEKGLGCTLA